MLRRDEIQQLESMDETEYTDYGSLMGAISGLTGVVSLNSQYGRNDKPIREKTNGEKFARFIGLDDDASTFSDNTGMSLSTMFTAATGRTGVTEATGRTAATNATGMTSAGGTFQRERSGMSKVSFKTQGTQHSKQSQRSHRSKESQATGRSKQSQRSHRSDQQPPRSPATRREQHRGGFCFFLQGGRGGAGVGRVSFCRDLSAGPSFSWSVLISQLVCPDLSQLVCPDL